MDRETIYHQFPPNGMLHYPCGHCQMKDIHFPRSQPIAIQNNGWKNMIFIYSLSTTTSTVISSLWIGSTECRVHAYCGVDSFQWKELKCICVCECMYLSSTSVEVQGQSAGVGPLQVGCRTEFSHQTCFCPLRHLTSPQFF